MVMGEARRTKRSWPRLLLALTRARVTIAVTLTTATGYILGAGRVDANLGMAVLGVFLLASGASALNQCQDARIDGLMERTRRRPLPAGLIDLPTALFVAILLMLAGLYVLASIGTNTGTLLLLSGFAVLWYNGVYAYLKRITAFAVVPGALIGAIPPVIGYLAAGGSFASPLVLLMGTFFFVWQIPHFWLLLLMCGSQYDDAGLPVLTRVFSPRQLLRITFMWLIATAAAGLVFPTMAHADLAIPWNLAIVVASFWLVSKAVTVLRSPAQPEQQRPLRRAFVQVNVYALIIMVCLSLNALQTATN